MSVIWDQYRELLERAREIEVAWRATGNACEAFADIAWERTADLDLSAFGDLASVPELLELPAISSLQHPSTFSDLYFKVFDNGKFWVEILNWWASDINVHDHNFSGVQFQLRGRSLNVGYAFRPLVQMPDLAFGELTITSAEVWDEGDRSIVRPGTVAPHNVSHLNVPTVSLILRTHPNAAYGGQRNYLPPAVAANYDVADIVFRKKVGSLRLLGGRRDPSFPRALERALDHQTDTENLFTLLKLVDVVFTDRYSRLLTEYASRGELQAAIVRAVSYHRAQQILNSAKWAPGLDDDEILAISMAAASFSSETFAAILELRGDRRAPEDWARDLIDSEGKLSASLRRSYRGALELLGLGHASETATDTRVPMTVGPTGARDGCA
jgi:hypothetical protein